MWISSSNDRSATSGSVPTRYAPLRIGGVTWSNAARSRRRIRLRSTAPPQRFETENATCGRSRTLRGETNATLMGPRRARPSGVRNSRKVADETTGSTGRRAIDLDSQTVAALGPTRAKDGSAGLRRHPRPESMGLSPLPGVGLVCALHCSLPSVLAPPLGPIAVCDRCATEWSAT